MKSNLGIDNAQRSNGSSATIIADSESRITEFNYSDGSDVRNEIIDYVVSKIMISRDIIKIINLEE